MEFAINLSIIIQIIKLCGMKKHFFILLLAVSVLAGESSAESNESFPSALSILATARNQLPVEPVRMKGVLSERAPNGFLKKALNIEMDLMWSEEPSRAVYRISNEKTGNIETLEILWKKGGPDYVYTQNGSVLDDFDPHTIIDGLDVTWADLSFSFLWHPDAETKGSGKKLGRECYMVSVPRPAGHTLLLWIEKKTGRMMGAKEETADGKTDKIIKVVSVKEFDDLWMVKDLDIIRPSEKGRTSLRIDSVEPF